MHMHMHVDVIVEAFSRLAPKMREYHRTQWAELTTAELETLHALLGRVLFAGTD
jgi:hypothetical protein